MRLRVLLSQRRRHPATVGDGRRIVVSRAALLKEQAAARAADAVESLVAVGLDETQRAFN